MTNAAIAQGSAHVCTAEHTQGNDAMAFAVFYAPPIFRPIGLHGAELECLTSNKERLNQLHSDVPANWPGQLPIHLAPLPRSEDKTAAIRYPALADWYRYQPHGNGGNCWANRHDHSQNRHLWFAHEVRVDQLGREWTRSFAAVTDDFGWLVEVPTA